MFSQFISGSAGPCFVALYIPKTPPRCWVLCFPPFAEEMNKSRAMISATARALVSSGVAVVVPDLYGTGDSTGDFSDAEWQTWQLDIADLTQWIQKQGAESIYFWGIRLGSLLALDAAEKSVVPISGLLLWQPVSSGQQMITQFLRLRMASGMMAGGAQEKVADLRERLKRGESLEVAGYELSPGLAQAIDRLRMLDMVPRIEMPVTWLEVSSSPGKSISMISKKILDAWQRAGVSVKAETVVGEPFWMTQEISIAPELIQRSSMVFTGPVAKENAELTGKPEYLPQTSELGELSIQFSCCGDTLSAVLHRGKISQRRGILLVVGGPQTRVGSHRQFVLLARDLAAAGVPVFRFDYRGMGDSSGAPIGFEEISEDIVAAIDCFQSALPQLDEVVIWGLCDAATAAAFYAPSDTRVTGLVLLNPWVRSEQGEAKAYIKHYYFGRLFSRKLWSKIITGKFNFFGSIKSLGLMLNRAVVGEPNQNTVKGSEATGYQTDHSLAQRIEDALDLYTGKVMLILSGNDLTAAEFVDATQTSKRFLKMIKQDHYTVVQMEEADHTFSRKIWRDAVAKKTLEWIKLW